MSSVMKMVNRLIQIWVAIGLLLPLSMVNADDELQISGFATIAATYSDSDDVDFRSSLANNPRDNFSLAPDSVFGLQANYRFNDHLDFMAQVVLDDRSEQSVDNYIEVVALRYYLTHDFAIRFGRLPSKLYMMSEYRSVGFAYPWMRPPIDMYSATTATSNFDGAEFVYTHPYQNGIINFSLALGTSDIRLDGNSGNFQLDFENYVGLNIEYQGLMWRLHATYARGTINNFQFAEYDLFLQALEDFPDSLWPEADSLALEFEVNGQDADYLTFGAFFDDGNWLINTEATKYGSDWVSFPDSLFGYIAVGKRFGDFTPFVSFGFNRPDDDFVQVTAPDFPVGTPAELQGLAQLLAFGANANVFNVAVDQASYSLGLRWDFAEKWAFKVQYDHFDIKNPGAGLFGNNAADLTIKDIELNAFSLGLTTTF